MVMNILSQKRFETVYNIALNKLGVTIVDTINDDSYFSLDDINLSN